MTPKDWYWVLSFIGIVGFLLNIKKKKSCFVLWTISNAGFIVVNILTGTYGQLPPWVVYLAMGIYGYIRWRKDERSSQIRDRLRMVCQRLDREMR